MGYAFNQELQGVGVTRLTRRKLLHNSALVSLAAVATGARTATAQQGRGIAAEIDSHYYYPQRRGLKSLLAQFEVKELEGRLRATIITESANNPDLTIDASSIRLEGLYAWDGNKRTRFAIDGWPAGYDPLELKRHEGVHKQMANLVVPDEHEFFFRDFDIQTEKSASGLTVTGRKKVAYTRIDSFTKSFSRDYRKTVLKGAGPEAIFQTTTTYVPFKGNLVFDELDFGVRVGSVDLHYTIRPYYVEIEGFILPSRIVLTYFDENGQIDGDPFELVSVQYAVNAGEAKPGAGKKKQ